MHEDWFYDRDWMIRAKCRGTDPDRYDADNRGNGQAKWAKEFCSACPALRDCATYAVEKKCTGVVMGGVPIPEQVAEPAWQKLKIIARMRDQ